MLKVFCALCAAAVLSGLGACAARPAGVDAALRPGADPRSVVVVRGDDGARVGWDELVSSAREARAVIIGENHGHPLGLAFAAALWSDVLAESPDAALSLEFFERDEQSRLDEYLYGVVDEATFRKRTQRSEGNYPAAHREMVEAAKAAGRPVIAANAPRPLVRLARLKGYERLNELSEEQLRMFRIPVRLSEGRYREDFMALMTAGPAHGEAADPEAVERAEAMFLSQSLWDWTMAESIALGLERGWRPIVHVVGRFHSDFRGGLVQALEDLDAAAKPLVISVVDERAGGLREEDRGRGDYVVYVGPVAERK